MPWTLQQINALFKELGFYSTNNVSVELQDDCLLLNFHDHGDLPVVLALGDKQILVEVALVERSEFKHPHEIDYKLLTSHKYLPLSTVAIENINGVDWYVLFGALSTKSNIEVIAEELLELLSNTFSVIDALEPLYKFNN